mmetsp:Transcript_44753/g.70002  ORF Transcript_44753/g.70002 Transcript_44753/m.70002 type:complete len:296 (-) Transcript_44753:457-1344(-)
MTACTAYGFARECSARQKCYPIPDENESGGGQGFQCLCNRSLLFHGTECASYHKVFMVTSVIRIIALVYITQQGSQAVYCLLQRRRTRSTSWAAIISASATLVVGATLSVDAIFNGVFRPHIEGNLWYNTYGRLIVQELVMFCLVLSCLSISLYFFEKVQQFRIIRKKTNTLVKGSERAALSCTAHGRSRDSAGWRRRALLFLDSRKPAPPRVSARSLHPEVLAMLAGGSAARRFVDVLRQELPLGASALRQLGHGPDELGAVRPLVDHLRLPVPSGGPPRRPAAAPLAFATGCA